MNLGVFPDRFHPMCPRAVHRREPDHTGHEELLLALPLVHEFCGSNRPHVKVARIGECWQHEAEELGLELGEPQAWQIGEILDA